jgi:hypothetical protein
MARRLTTNQEIAGSIPAVLILLPDWTSQQQASAYLVHLFAEYMTGSLALLPGTCMLN